MYREDFSEGLKTLARTNVFYLSTVAYFHNQIKSPWKVFEAVTRHASTLTGEVRGDISLIATTPGEGATYKATSTRPTAAESISKIAASKENQIWQVAFEGCKLPGPRNKVDFWRPDLVVIYENRVRVRAEREVGLLQSLAVNIHHKYLLDKSPTRLSSWLLKFWNIVDKTDECAQGLCQFACADAGAPYHDYDEGGEGPILWERRLTDARFIYAEDRLSKMRGVYWGTFIGKSVAAKLDPNKTLLQRYNKLPYYGLVSSPKGRATTGGGYWLQMNNDPIGADAVHGDIEQMGALNALWLERELRAKDLIW